MHSKQMFSFYNCLLLAALKIVICMDINKDLQLFTNKTSLTRPDWPFKYQWDIVLTAAGQTERELPEQNRLYNTYFVCLTQSSAKVTDLDKTR